MHSWHPDSSFNAWFYCTLKLFDIGHVFNHNRSEQSDFSKQAQSVNRNIKFESSKVTKHFWYGNKMNTFIQPYCHSTIKNGQ